MNIFSVIVTYFPDPAGLLYLCRVLAEGGSRVVVVDNTDPERSLSIEARRALPACTWIEVGRNSGIAHAQNRGIAFAIDSGADAVVFFDQDSRPDRTFVPTIISGLSRGSPGVVAPVCRDATTGTELPSLAVNRFGMLRKVYAGQSGSPYPVDLVISSGSAATVETFALVGKMDEDYFIDFVDFEWCFRCREKKVPITIQPQAIMRHSIGDRAVDLGMFKGVVHSASRSYYKIRNCFLNFRKPSVPLLFSTRALIVGLVQYVALIPATKQRRTYMRVLFRAVGDGLKGVVGADPATSGRRAQGAPT